MRVSEDCGDSCVGQWKSSRCVWQKNKCDEGECVERRDGFEFAEIESGNDGQKR